MGLLERCKMFKKWKSLPVLEKPLHNTASRTLSLLMEHPLPRGYKSVIAHFSLGSCFMIGSLGDRVGSDFEGDSGVYYKISSDCGCMLYRISPALKLITSSHCTRSGGQPDTERLPSCSNFKDVNRLHTHTHMHTGKEEELHAHMLLWPHCTVSWGGQTDDKLFLCSGLFSFHPSTECGYPRANMHAHHIHTCRIIWLGTRPANLKLWESHLHMMCKGSTKSVTSNAKWNYKTSNFEIKCLLNGYKSRRKKDIQRWKRVCP